MADASSATPDPRKPRPWARPNSGVIGHTVAANLTLARSELAALWVSGLTVYGEGFVFELEVRHRLEDDAAGHPLYPPISQLSGDAPDAIAADALWIGVEFADGGSATTREPAYRRVAPEADSPPEPPVLRFMGGGGSRGLWQQRFHVWPLPPAGALTFCCEWAAARVPLARAAFDSELLRAAAEHVEVIWADPPNGGYARDIDVMTD